MQITHLGISTISGMAKLQIKDPTQMSPHFKWSLPSNFFTEGTSHLKLSVQVGPGLFSLLVGSRRKDLALRGFVVPGASCLVLRITIRPSSVLVDFGRFSSIHVFTCCFLEVSLMHEDYRPLRLMDAEGRAVPGGRKD